MRQAYSAENTLRCSFCSKTQENAGKLIANPSQASSRAYICDECVALCAAIIEDDKVEVRETEAGSEARPPHPLLTHPLASELLEASERWVHEESLGRDGLAALAEVRRIASHLFRDGG